jgi:hypothetical protein
MGKPGYELIYVTAQLEEMRINFSAYDELWPTGIICPHRIVKKKQARIKPETIRGT